MLSEISVVGSDSAFGLGEWRARSTINAAADDFQLEFLIIQVTNLHKRNSGTEILCRLVFGHFLSSVSNNPVAKSAGGQPQRIDHG